MRPAELLVAFASAAALAAPLAAQQLPPIRTANEVVAKTSEPMVMVTGVRALSDGSVLVNDAMGRRVVRFDRALAMVGVAADSTPSTANAYGPRPGTLVEYRGDSTLFIDAASLSMLVIDPSGKIVRVMSVPRSQDAGSIAGFGGAAFDSRGRLVYRAAPSFQMRGGPGSGGPQIPQIPDSTALVRVDLTSRQLDTITFLKMPRVNVQVSEDNGRFTVRSVVNPLPIVDEWGVLSDGTVAVMRGRDYRLELFGDAAVAATHRVNYDWQRLTDEDKVAFIDSVRVARERMMADAPAAAARGGDVARMAQPTPGGGGQVMVFGGPGGGMGGGAAQMRGGAGGPGGPQLTLVDPSELPDYRPPFFAGSIRTDKDGNLWIRTTRMTNGAPVYDVVSSDGEVIDRVAFAAGRTLVGFGPDGMAYLSWREGESAGVEAVKVR